MKVIKTRIKYQISYDLLDIKSLRLECAVPFNIFIKKENGYVIILEAGTVLTQRLYNILQEKENVYVLKKEAGKQVLSCETLQTYITHNKNEFLKSLELLTEVNTKLFDLYFNNADDGIELPCVENIVKSIIFLIKQHPSYLKETIVHFKNDHNISDHSLYVTIYAMNLGFFLKLPDNQLLQLGTAALLHDIGFKKIDDAIRNKTSKLNEEESASIQKHPGLSVELAKLNEISDPYILNAIMQHHECYDTSGYPRHLRAKNISHGAAILAICDVFNALTNDRPYRLKYSSFEALQLMIKDESMAMKFNQNYVRVFLKSLR